MFSLSRALELARVEGNVVGEAHTLIAIASFCVEAGLISHSRSAIDDLFSITKMRGLTWIHGTAHLLNGQLSLEERQFDHALVSLQRAVLHLEEGKHLPFLIATRLYIALTYEFLGDMRMSDAVITQAHEMIESFKGHGPRLYLETVRTIQLLRHRSLEDVTEHVQTMRAQYAGDHPYLNTYCDVAQAFVEAARLEQAMTMEDDTEAFYRKKQVLSLISRVRDPRGTEHGALSGASYLQHDDMLRVLMALLVEHLPQSLRDRLSLELQDPRAVALLVDESTRSYRPPNQLSWVTKMDQPVSYRLFFVLLANRLDVPGAFVSAQTLLEATWPDERLTVASADNRLYVMLSKLRQEGLMEVILNNDQRQYCLDASIDVFTMS